MQCYALIGRLVWFSGGRGRGMRMANRVVIFDDNRRKAFRVRFDHVYVVRCFLLSVLVHALSVFFESAAILATMNVCVCSPFSLEAAHIHPHSAPNRSPLNAYLALATSIEPVHPPFLTFIPLLSEHVCRPRKRVQAPFEPVRPSSKHIGRYL